MEKMMKLCLLMRLNYYSGLIGNHLGASVRMGGVCSDVCVSKYLKDTSVPAVWT